MERSLQIALSRSSPPSAAPRADGEQELFAAPLLAALNQRANLPGSLQLAGHLILIALGALLWSLPLHGGWWFADRLPSALLWLVGGCGLLLLGWGLAFAFCAMHEAGHRTAFASRSFNDNVAWWAGVLSFYNADFYRRYHQWHHRYTHQPGLDPELEDAPPTTLSAYLLELSGLPWWRGKIQGHLAGLRGDFGRRAYIPADAVPALQRSLRWQFAVYALAALLSLPAANGFVFWYWLLPLAVGQPLLRFVLLAEHSGCAHAADGLSNTRTTLTLAPLRWLMWNMPFHAEHHLYPSLPFHALARAHTRLAPRLVHLSPGYLAVHKGLLTDLAALALPAAPSTSSM